MMPDTSTEKPLANEAEIALSDQLKETTEGAEIIAASHHQHGKSAAEKALLRKADLVILPLTSLAYFVAYLDRNNIGNARIMGLQDDLNMTDGQWFNCLTMFFVGFIAFMLPANLFNRYLKPHYALGGGVIAWGAVCAGLSGSKNYVTVLVLRLFLGFGQAFIQTVNLYTSLWYTRDELGFRSSIFFSVATFSGSFGGLIAYAISVGVSQWNTYFESWGWLFLIEGTVAMGVGFFVIFMLPRYPDNLHQRKEQGKKHWLFSDEDIDIAAARFAKFNTGGERFKPAQLLAVVKDPKSYMFAVCQGAAAFGIANMGAFLPTFINQFGFNDLNTQLFSIIPYACAGISVLTFGYLSDRFNTKFPFLLLTYTACAVGYVVLLCETNPVAGIIAACLVAAGCYVPVVLLPVWMFINTAGYTKRATTWPMCEVVGLSLAIMGTRVYDTPPRFIKGHSITLGINCAAIICTIAAYFYMRAQNRKRDRIQREYAERGEVHPHIAENLTLEHVQDYHISFRYVL